MTDPIFSDPFVAALVEVAREAGYATEIGDSELLDPSTNAGVCVYSRQLIQLHPGLRSNLPMARFILIHEVAHALLHKSYGDDSGVTRSKHEREANSVRKLIWMTYGRHPFDFGPTNGDPGNEVTDVVNRIAAALEKIPNHGAVRMQPPAPQFHCLTCEIQGPNASWVEVLEPEPPIHDEIFLDEAGRYHFHGDPRAFRVRCSNGHEWAWMGHEMAERLGCPTCGPNTLRRIQKR